MHANHNSAMYTLATAATEHLVHALYKGGGPAEQGIPVQSKSHLHLVTVSTIHCISSRP